MTYTSTSFYKCRLHSVIKCHFLVYNNLFFELAKMQPGWVPILDAKRRRGRSCRRHFSDFNPNFKYQVEYVPLNASNAA